MVVLMVVPLMVVTPLTFLGGAFYSISMLPPVWQTITLFNPVVYLVSGFRWSFYGISDVNVVVSLAAIVGFLAACLLLVWWIFHHRLRPRSVPDRWYHWPKRVSPRHCYLRCRQVHRRRRLRIVPR